MTTDWTTGEGRSNNSESYLFLVQQIKGLIVGDAYTLLSGNAEMTARLILSNLAHKYGLAPTKTLQEMQDE